MRLLGKQQRIYRQSKRPADLRRADDAEAAAPFDPKSAAQVAEDFYAAGRLPQWMRGVGDESFDGRGYSRGTSESPPVATSSQWEINSGEGWCADPFGRHEARWISNGSPTNLVRDRGVESRDEPPTESERI